MSPLFTSRPAASDLSQTVIARCDKSHPKITRSAKVPKIIARWSLAAATIFLLVACSSSGASNPGPEFKPPPNDPGPPPSNKAIVYLLTGSASSADLTLQLSGGGQSQQQNVGVPLMNKDGDRGLRFFAAEGDFLYISAQNNGGGTLHCQIRENGVVVADQTSSGQYAIVTCSGSA